MKKLILLLLVMNSSVILAQQTANINRTFHVEVDPIAYALKGYSVHVIYQVNKFSFDAGIFGIQPPEGFTGNKGFLEKMNGAGIKAHYHFSGIKGWFTGLSAGYSSMDIKHKASGSSDTGKSVGIGADAGYRFFFWKDQNGRPTGLYLMPWVSIGYDVYQEKINIIEKEYKQQPVSFFPTIHIGYRFK